MKFLKESTISDELQSQFQELCDKIKMWLNRSQKWGNLCLHCFYIKDSSY